MRREARIAPAWRWAAILVAALITTAGGAALVLDQLTDDAAGVDDAAIYLRYAKNLAGGHGLVWNPGGERVEGFTSWPWLAVCALAVKLAARPEKALLGISIVLVAAGAGAWAIGRAELTSDPRRAEPDRAGAFVLHALGALAWLAASPGFFLWNATSLLDTGLFTALLLAASVAVIHAGRSGARLSAASALVAAVAVTRPEGAALAVALTACLYVAARRAKRPALSLAARPLALAAVALLAQLAVRRAYFGWLFPNTYYAKVGSDVAVNLRAGAAYLAGIATAYPIAALALLVAIAGAAAWIGSIASPRIAALLAPHGAWIDLLGASSLLLLAGAATVVWVGGDHFGSWRFMQPYWPLVFDVLVAAIAVAARLAIQPARLGPAIGGALLIAGATYALAPVRWLALAETSDTAREFIIAEEGRVVGEVLSRVFAGDDRPSLGVITAGALPLTYAGRSIDLLGLNDVAMAHARRDRDGPRGHAAFDTETFFRDPPGLLVLYPRIVCDLGAPVTPFSAGWPARVLRHVGDDPRFRARYEAVVITDPTLARAGKGICAYLAGDLVSRWERRAMIARLSR